MIGLTLSILLHAYVYGKRKENPHLYVLFDLSKDPHELDNVYDGVAGNVKSALNNVMIQYRIFVTFLP